MRRSSEGIGWRGRLKGPERPFIPARQRALMLASLEAVDYVVTFGEDTPLRLVRRIQPDVLVKGGEWTQETIVGHDVVTHTRYIATGVEPFRPSWAAEREVS